MLTKLAGWQVRACDWVNETIMFPMLQPEPITCSTAGWGKGPTGKAQEKPTQLHKHAHTCLSTPVWAHGQNLNRQTHYTHTTYIQTQPSQMSRDTNTKSTQSYWSPWKAAMIVEEQKKCFVKTRLATSYSKLDTYHLLTSYRATTIKSGLRVAPEEKPGVYPLCSGHFQNISDSAFHSYTCLSFQLSKLEPQPSLDSLFGTSSDRVWWKSHYSSNVSVEHSSTLVFTSRSQCRFISILECLIYCVTFPVDFH